MDFFRIAGDRIRSTVRSADRALGGLLPGGGVPAAPTLRRMAGSALNVLPAPANLFIRYVTPVGGANLKLDKKTEKSLLRAAEAPPTRTVPIPPGIRKRTEMEGFNPELFVHEEIIPGSGAITPEPPVIRMELGGFNEVIPGPGVITPGPVIPYGGREQAASLSLGSYNVDRVTPDKVVISDTPYDMVNPSEDPELVRGTFRPDKALAEIRGIFDNKSGFLNERRLGRDSYNDRQQSNFNTPTTAAARALLYLLPYTPKPYEIKNSPEGYVINRDEL